MYSVRQVAGARPSEHPPRSGTPLTQQWIAQCQRASLETAKFYSGCRKILSPWYFSLKLDKSLQLADAGYTSNKMRMLERNYVHQESINAALKLWDKRLATGKYGSVGFTTYNHFMKGNIKGASPRGSVMGPCIQSITLTLVKEGTIVDAFYRTTELYKKFPADLVFIRDVLLPPFKFDRPPEVRFHFANVTVHPMYWVTTAPHLDDPAAALSEIKDIYFRNWLIKWTARYVCPEFSRGIQKFSQALRVRKDAVERIDKAKMKKLQSYLRKNHPGYRGDYTEEDDE